VGVVPADGDDDGEPVVVRAAVEATCAGVVEGSGSADRNAVPSGIPSATTATAAATMNGTGERRVDEPFDHAAARRVPPESAADPSARIPASSRARIRSRSGA
jgi:hypothetical protein